MNYEKLIKSPRIWIMIIFLIISVIAIRPTIVPNADGTFDIETSIKKGLDLEGGVRALLEPDQKDSDTLNLARATLQTRVNALGLTETKIQIISGKYIQVEIAGKTETELREILEKQGMFEAKIKRHITIKETSASFKIDGNAYNISIDNDTIIIDGNTLSLNDTSSVEGLPFAYTNNTGNELTLEFDIFTGNDVKAILRDSQYTRIGQSGDKWKFQFGIVLSPDAAKNFAKVTKDMATASGGYLAEDIDFYLDNELVDSLKIGSGLKGQPTTEIIISGPGDTKEDATNNMLTLQAILESGALPTTMKMIKIETISPTLGEQFTKSAIMAVMLSLLVISIIIYIRYRDPAIVIPIIITALSEVILILGFASITKWTIDLAAIAGIIAAVGTGVDDQIIITDESKYNKILMNFAQRLKNAFFIIFTAFFTTVAAMFPLLFIGAGGIKGFALTTIVGVTIGVIITRPAYAKVIELLRE